jgi:hypothetical protein
MGFADYLDLLAAILLSVLSAQRFYYIARRRPFISVGNAKSLVFAGGFLALTFYFWLKILKMVLL